MTATPPIDPAPQTPGAPAGWYMESGRQRWWDGITWGDYAQTVVIARPPSTNGIALAGLILGIVALVLALIPLLGWFFFPIPALLAIIFGFVGLSNFQRLRRPESIFAIILGFSPIPITIIQFIIGSALGSGS